MPAYRGPSWNWIQGNPVFRRSRVSPENPIFGPAPREARGRKILGFFDAMFHEFLRSCKGSIHPATTARPSARFPPDRTTGIGIRTTDVRNASSRPHALQPVQPEVTPTGSQGSISFCFLVASRDAEAAPRAFRGTWPFKYYE